MSTLSVYPRKRLEIRPTEGTAVYLAYDKDDRLLYVGIADELVKRIGQHAGKSGWWGLLDHLEYEEHPTRHAAARRESDLIGIHKPPYNKSQNPRAKGCDHSMHAMARCVGCKEITAAANFRDEYCRECADDLDARHLAEHGTKRLSALERTLLAEDLMRRVLADDGSCDDDEEAA